MTAILINLSRRDFEFKTKMGHTTLRSATDCQDQECETKIKTKTVDFETKTALLVLHGSYYFAEFIFPDFSRQNEWISLTNLFKHNVNKPIVGVQVYNKSLLHCKIL